MQEADDMVLVLMADWVARELLFENDVEILVHSVLEVEADHVRARRHDLADVEVREVEDVVDKVDLRVVDEALAVALLHEQAYLFLGVGVVALRSRVEAHAVCHPVGYVVEQPDERVHDAVEDEHRQGHAQHDLLDVLDGHRLRRQFAEHDVQARDDGEGERQCNRVADDIIESDGVRDRQDQRRDGRFADPAEAERGERDAELCHGKRCVKVVGQLLGVLRLTAALLDERLETRGAYLDAGKLCRDKEAVHRDEEENEQ